MTENDLQSTPPLQPDYNSARDAQFSETQRITDASHLNILAVCYYVSAGLSALGGCFGVIYIILGALFASGSQAMQNQQGGPPPEALGWIFVGVGGCVVLAGLAVAGVQAYAARCLQQRRRMLFCQIVAGFSCLSIPLGTILGVFTFVVLARPSVKALFAANADTPSH